MPADPSDPPAPGLPHDLEAPEAAPPAAFLPEIDLEALARRHFELNLEAERLQTPNRD